MRIGLTRLLAATAFALACGCGNTNGGPSASTDGDASGPHRADGGSPSSVPHDDAGRDDSAATLPDVGVVDPEPSPTDGAAPPFDPGTTTLPWVAFASNRSGNFDIYLVRSDGTGLHRIVKGPGQDLFPSWSADGAKLTFATNATGAYLLHVVDIATGIVTPLTSTATYATSPSYSPDGVTIAFGGTGPGGNGIYSVDVGGGAAKPIAVGSARAAAPVWAMDGSAIYFATNKGGAFDVWSVKPDGTGAAQVTTGTGILGGPALSPDGKKLAIAQSGPPGKVTLFTIATKATQTLTAMGDSEPSFSKSGATVAVTSTRFGESNQEIVLVDVAGVAPPFRLTYDPGVDGQAAFQPYP